MPRAQNVSCQPSNLIVGHATLLVAHAIFSAPRAHSDRARTNTRNEEDQDGSICSADQDESISSADQDESIGSADQNDLISSADQDELTFSADQDESICSADSDPSDGSVDSLDLPLQAHMLPGRGRRLSVVVPVLLVADPHNIIPLLCSALYQRHVWGIHQPVVGLCCSSTGTIATAIFGWLESDQSEEGRMPTAHLALAADIRADPLMGVFDFTDTSSAISLAQFVLGLRTHFEDIKGATSIEAVDSLTPFHWRSDLPDFETQFWGQSDERVASWTNQVHVQTSSSEASSSSTPRTPSPLLDTARVYETTSSPLLPTIVEDEQDHGVNIRLQDYRATKAKGRGKGSQSLSLEDSSQPQSEVVSLRALSNSQFTGLSDNGLGDKASISNWLFERHACTIGRIKIKSGAQANKTEINAMVDLYDQITASIGSKEIEVILSNANIDSSVSNIKKELKTNAGHNSQSNETNVLSPDDIEFISSRLSALLHAVKGACSCDDAKLRGVNEAFRRHEWDALLLNFFEPFTGRRDVLLERQLNLARNLAADDSSSAKWVVAATLDYEALCFEQFRRIVESADSDNFNLEQAQAARNQAVVFSNDILRRAKEEKFKTHSYKDPVTRKCDAILVVPISGVQDPKPEKLDASKGENSLQTGKAASHKTISKEATEVPSIDIDHARESRNFEHLLRNPFFLCYPDGEPATQEKETMPSKNISTDELLLPVLVAEHKKMGASGISTAMNEMRIYQVSAVTFLSTLGITGQPVFGLVVNGTLGAITMAWKTRNQIYVMEHNVRHYDIRDPLQALQFVSILLRLARHGVSLRGLLEGQPAISDVKPWSKLYQRQEDKIATKRTESEQAVAQDCR
ncbi:hypothetical protein P692DRAFT_20868302 [Suillus brevipes Sb2]|nr:hypothetical protein P692DRAFT_20868302 [Suillus brevipes Sb2]